MSGEISAIGRLPVCTITRTRLPLFGVLASGLVALCLLTSCGGSGGEEASTAPIVPSGTEVLVNPSANAQNFTVSGVNVTIPGDVLQTPQTLQVRPVSQPPANQPLPDMQTVGLYSISLQSAQNFDKPLVVEFPYDAATLGGDAADGKNLWVSYLDETRNEWVRVEATVDKSRQKIAVTTDHLSTWWIYQLRGYDYVPKGRATFFEVYYRTTHTNPRVDVTGQSMKGLAEDVLSALETARSNYKSAGFRVSDGTITVLIGDVGSSEWGRWGGSIDLKRSTLVDLAHIRNDSAHELFHSVQNKYYFTGGMANRYWLIEGTPDFMAYRYGWNKTYASDFEALDLAWFGTSLFSKTKDVEAYPLAHFLRYLQDARAVDIKKLWDFVASWWANAPGAFRTNVADQTGKSFDDVWKDFVYASMFGPGKLAESRGNFFSLASSAGEISKGTTLSPGYTAKLLKAEVATCTGNSTRSYQFSVDTTASGAWGVELWSTTPEGYNPVFLGKVYSGKLALPDLLADSSRVLFAVAFNPALTEVPITLKLAAPACGQGPMITSLSPNSGGAGTQVTIAGTGFGTPDAPYATSQYNLRVGGISYGLGDSWSGTRIVFTLSNVAPGSVDVVVTSGGLASGAATFTVTANCQIQDMTTGLTWTIDGNPAGAVKTYANAQAWAAASTLCGQAGWRLPTQSELLNSGPLLRASPFVNNKGSYWTSTACNTAGSSYNLPGHVIVFVTDGSSFCARDDLGQMTWPVHP